MCCNPFTIFNYFQLLRKSSHTTGVFQTLISEGDSLQLPGFQQEQRFPAMGLSSKREASVVMQGKSDPKGKSVELEPLSPHIKVTVGLFSVTCHNLPDFFSSHPFLDKYKY
jgi:hypothetical protein